MCTDTWGIEVLPNETEDCFQPLHMISLRNTGVLFGEIFHLDAGFATGMLLAERFEMYAQDVVFVDTAGISQWNRVISQLLPSISVIGVVDNVTR